MLVQVAKQASTCRLRSLSLRLTAEERARLCLLRLLGRPKEPTAALRLAGLLALIRIVSTGIVSLLHRTVAIAM